MSEEKFWDDMTHLERKEAIEEGFSGGLSVEMVAQRLETKSWRVNNFANLNNIPLPQRRKAKGVPRNRITTHYGADETCLWPVSDSSRSNTAGFCGKPRKEGKPYCEEHCKNAYIKPKSGESVLNSIP